MAMKAQYRMLLVLCTLCCAGTARAVNEQTYVEGIDSKRLRKLGVELSCAPSPPMGTPTNYLFTATIATNSYPEGGVIRASLTDSGPAWAQAMTNLGEFFKGQAREGRIWIQFAVTPAALPATSLKLQKLLYAPWPCWPCGCIYVDLYSAAPAARSSRSLEAVRDRIQGLKPGMSRNQVFAMLGPHFKWDSNPRFPEAVKYSSRALYPPGWQLNLEWSTNNQTLVNAWITNSQD
jgi:hypothetical protein